MTDTNPIDTIVVDGTPPVKGDVRDYFDRICLAADLDDIRGRDLSDAIVAIVRIDDKPFLLALDPTDSTSTDDGETCIVDAVGNRFKIRSVSTSDLTAAMLNTIFGPGGADLDILPPGTDPSVLGYSGGAWASLPIGTLVGLLDTFFGGTDWRAEVSGDSSTVISYPANSWKNGCLKGNGISALLFGDGQVRVAGSASGPNPDGSATAISRYMAIAFSDGVQRSISKFWIGGQQNLYAQDTNGITYGCGANSNGELGLGDTTKRSTWTEITFFRTNSLTVADIQTSSRGAYFTATNGQLYYCGDNSTGQGGDGTFTTPRTAPVRCGTLTGVTAVFAGTVDNGASSCVGALAAGTFYVWAYNGFSNLGLGDTTNRNVPSATGLTGVVKACMGRASIVLKSDGTSWTAGYNGDGGTCQGTFTGNTTTWTQIASLGTTVIDIASTCGGFTTMGAIVSIGGVGRYFRDWGYNGGGQLGIGGTTSQNTVQSPSGTWQGSVDEIGGCGPSAASGSSAILVRVGNRILTSGYNANANLVNGTVTGNTSAFGDVLGIIGSIDSMYSFAADTGLILSVTTDQGVFNGGYNGTDALATHELTPHNQGVLQKIIFAGSVGPGLTAVGYAVGAGGTVMQATSKATAVTLNKFSGAITTNAASLAAGAIVSFALSNSQIAAADVLVLNHISGGTRGAYSLNAACAAGSATIYLRNNTSGALAESLVIQFAIIKGADS